MPTFSTLPGSKRTLLPSSRAAGPADPNEIASVTIRVRSQRDPLELAKLATDLGGTLPLSKRQYLSHAELAAKHGASATDLDAVEQYASQHDLEVTHRSALERTIVVRGTLRRLLSAFHANVQMFHHSTGTYRGRQGEIAIPKELAGVITAIIGFDTRPKRRTQRPRVHGDHDGPGGDNGLAPTAFATRYHFPDSSGGVALDGTGQTIAIIELGGGYRTADLDAYFSELGIATPQVSSVSVDHGANRPSNAQSADDEVMLDIEVAGAVAPNAKLVVYFAPNTNQGFLDAVSAAVHDSERKPGVISISWGGPEDTNDPQTMQAFHEVFAAAGALGITVCVASGDHGCADDASGNWDQQIHVDHPPCDDLVLGCGGTQIDNGVDVVWNDRSPFDPTVDGGGGWTSGGGISQVFAVPAYQHDIALPAALAGGHAGRGVPDIAMSATNYFTRTDGFEGAGGGTSAVAPLMAGLIARLNQAKAKNVGFLNPLLYANAATVMHDVTIGDNVITNGPAGYSAGPGWDACTGLGTPDGVAILAKL